MAMSPRKIGEGLYQPLAEINVTPLVDVMLVLLIIFMVTAPMLATGIKVNLPSAQDRDQPLETKEPVVVVVAKDGAVSVGKDPVSQDELAAKVKDKLSDSNGVVQLRGDRDASYGDVVSVMDELAANGVTRIAIVSSGRRSSGLPRSDAEAMTAATLDGRIFEPPSPNPPWLRPVVVAIVIALHAAALSIVYLSPKPLEPPREVVVDIQPEAPPQQKRPPPAPQDAAPPPEPTPHGHRAAARTHSARRRGAAARSPRRLSPRRRRPSLRRRSTKRRRRNPSARRRGAAARTHAAYRRGAAARTQRRPSPQAASAA